MKPAKLILLVAGVASAAFAGVWAAQGRAAPARPNFLIIVADDLGYSDVGAFGGEIETPNIDALARAGVRLTGFHTAPTCSPTRAMLLTGTDHHAVGVGTMAERLTPGLRNEGYEGELNEKAATLAQRLQAAGYFTAMAGKWHLGMAEERSPKARGFDRSFALLDGAGNHFGEDQAGEPYAVAVAGGTTSYRQDGKIARYPVGAFSADAFTDRMLGYIDEARGAGKPFLAYLAYTEPHWPLQAPADIIDKYKGRYDDGPEALRDRRLARMKALGLIAPDVRPHPMDGVKPWASLSAAERAIEARKMEVYAAMVDRMDQTIGRVIQRLKATGQYENTVIVFMSDNGAEGSVQDERMVQASARSGGVSKIDNSLANIGRAGSYVSYGLAWALAGSAPSRLYKGWTTEGGIHTPAIVAGPNVKGGRNAAATTVVADITPTLLEIAGIKAQASFQGRAVLPIGGRSWAPLLAGRSSAVHGADEPLGWELFFGRALRQGDWKAVYLRPNLGGAGGAGRWELFDLKADPGETDDRSKAEPQRLAALAAAWNAYAKRVGVVVEPPQESPGR